MSDPRRFWFDHAALLTIATRLRDDRAARDRRCVESGALTADAATERAACASALVALWTHVAEATPFDVLEPLASLGASWFQLRRDLDAALAGADALATKAPDDRLRRDMADCLATMRRQLDEAGASGLPNVAFCHDFNLWMRAQREPARKAA